MKIKDISYYLFESYEDAVEKFSQEEDKETVNQYLDSFKQLAKKGIVTGQEKDIGYWIKQGWNEFKKFVDNKSQEKTQSQVKQSKKKDVIIALDDDEKMAVIPLTKDASCFYGKGTRWCTSATKGKNYFNSYFYIRNTILVYVFMKNSGEKYSMSYSEYGKDENEYFNEMDRKIPKQEFEYKTNLSFDEIKSWVKEYETTIFKFMDMNNLSSDKQIELIKEMPFSLRYINKPSKEAQLAAIKRLPLTIKHIEDPSEELQLAAVREDGAVISVIDDPSENVKLAAVQQNGYVIEYIDDPSEEIQIAAINENYTIINKIKNPSEEVQLAAVRKNYFNIKDIENPTEKVQLIAIEELPSIIKSIKNPTQKAQIAAIKKRSRSIELIDNPTEKAKQLHQELWGV